MTTIMGFLKRKYKGFLVGCWVKGDLYFDLFLGYKEIEGGKKRESYELLFYDANSFKSKQIQS